MPKPCGEAAWFARPNDGSAGVSARAASAVIGIFCCLVEPAWPVVLLCSLHFGACKKAKTFCKTYIVLRFKIHKLEFSGSSSAGLISEWTREVY